MGGEAVPAVDWYECEVRGDGGGMAAIASRGEGGGGGRSEVS